MDMTNFASQAITHLAAHYRHIGKTAASFQMEKTQRETISQARTDQSLD